MELFVKLYLDEDVDVLVAALLRSRGFDVVTTVEAGNLGTTDLQQLEYAAASGRALLTHNRVDFEKLAAEWLASGKTHGGMFIAVRHAAHEIARRSLAILNDVTADEIENQVRYL